MQEGLNVYVGNLLPEEIDTCVGECLKNEMMQAIQFCLHQKTDVSNSK